MDKNLSEIITNSITNATTYAILTHRRPDGDALASSLAVFWYLIDIGKEVNNIDVIIPEFIKDFSFIPGIEHLKATPSKEKYDLVIMVDCADLHLLEGISILKRTKNLICFDHHEETTVPFTYGMVRPIAPSCSYILYKTFPCMNKNFLNCVSIGLISDTSNLSLNVSPLVTKTIQELEKLGVDINYFLSKLTSQSHRTLELVDIVLKRGYFKSNSKNSIFCTYLLQEDLLDSEKNLNTVNHKAIISELQKSVSYNSLVLLIENDKGEFKGSLRTNTSIDLNAICSKLILEGKLVKGGGHNYSAGFTAIGSPAPIIDIVTTELFKN